MAMVATTGVVKRRSGRTPTPFMQMMQDMMEEAHGNEVQVVDAKYACKQDDGTPSRRASSPSMQIMQDMAEEDSPASRSNAISELSVGVEELKITNDDTNFSRQTTRDTDTSPWSRQTTPQSNEPERMSSKESNRASRRRQSSPSMHMMEEMARERHGVYEPEEEITIVKEVLFDDRPRRRASSPSMQMMEDMAEEL